MDVLKMGGIQEVFTCFVIMYIHNIHTSKSSPSFWNENCENLLEIKTKEINFSFLSTDPYLTFKIERGQPITSLWSTD